MPCSEILALRHSQWQDYLKHPEDSFTFLFTAEDGTVYYGSCVQKTELVEVCMATHPLDPSPLPPSPFFAPSLRTGWPRASGRVRGLTGCQRGDSGLVGTTELPEGFYATTRRCYCVISRFPFFRLHMDFLYSLFGTCDSAPRNDGREEWREI